MGYIKTTTRLPEISKETGESDYVLCISSTYTEPFVAWLSYDGRWYVSHHSATGPGSILEKNEVICWAKLPKTPKYI